MNGFRKKNKNSSVISNVYHSLKNEKKRKEKHKQKLRPTGRKTMLTKIQIEKETTTSGNKN